jgi:hypothetical protein
MSSDFTSDISIAHKIYKFYLILSSTIELFPKKDRHTLGLRLSDITLEIIELALLAHSKQQKSSKALILNKIDVKLKLLKYLIRASLDTKATDEKKYIILEEHLQEIGRMLGGWIRSIK